MKSHKSREPLLSRIADHSSHSSWLLEIMTATMSSAAHLIAVTTREKGICACSASSSEVVLVLKIAADA